MDKNYKSQTKNFMFKIFEKKKKGEEVTLKIEGMHCNSCAMNIDGELEELDCVIEASTSYAKSETKVVLRQEVDKNKLIEAVGKAGYKAKVV